MENLSKKNQYWAFGIIAFLSLLTMVTYAMNQFYIYLAAYLWFGFVYGMCLQYGRFCFSSAFRDLFAVGALKAVKWIFGKPAGLYSMQDVLKG